MLLVAIDTSGRNGSVALCRGDQRSFEALQRSLIEGGTYSARLMPVIAEMLVRERISKEELDAFVVVSGPGSFTGLRVGISTVKGLCEVLRKPLVAVSMLEVLASVRGPGTGRVDVVLDAGRGEAYIGEYALENSHPTTIREYIAKLDSFAAEAVSRGATVFTPDTRVAEALFAAGVAAQKLEPVLADEIGAFGLSKLLSGQTADPATLDANYIRRSDAEIFATPKR